MYSIVTMCYSPVGSCIVAHFVRSSVRFAHVLRFAWTFIVFYLHPLYPQFLHCAEFLQPVFKYFHSPIYDAICVLWHTTALLSKLPTILATKSKVRGDGIRARNPRLRVGFPAGYQNGSASFVSEIFAPKCLCIAFTL